MKPTLRAQATASSSSFFFLLYLRKKQGSGGECVLRLKNKINTGRGENFFLGGEKKAFERPNRKTGAALTIF